MLFADSFQLFQRFVNLRSFHKITFLIDAFIISQTNSIRKHYSRTNYVFVLFDKQPILCYCMHIHHEEWIPVNKKRQILISISSIAFAVLVCIIPIILIRNLGSLISLLGPLFDLKPKDVKQFSAIFAQLSNARIDPPFWVSVLFGIGLFGFLSAQKPKHTAARVILSCIFAFVLFPVAVVTVFLFTNVNSIRICDVLQSLLQVLSAGGF